MDRRQFLKTGGVIAGGLLIGVSTAEPAVAAGVRSSGSNTGAASASVPGTLATTDHDLNPMSSALTAPAAGRLLLDQDYRSVGLDLGQATTVNALQLVTDTAAHRLNPRDVAVYTSNDNKTWTKQSSEFLDLGTTIWLYGLNAQTRYVKVHCYRDGAAADATFGNGEPQKLLAAFAVPAGSFVGAGGGTWAYQVPIKITNSTGNTLTDRAAYISHAALGTTALIQAGKLRSDLADLRFADPQGHQLHAYDDGDGVFVRIPSVKANGCTPIFAHIGNPTAQSVLADAGALQVEYGNRSYQPLGETSSAGLAMQGDVHPIALPDGTLLMTGGAAPAAGVRGAFIENDTNPATGNFSSYPTTNLAFDYDRRSIGLSFGAPRDVSSLVLTGLPANATGGKTTRLQPSDLGIWISNTNKSDWKKVSGWSGTKSGLTITMTGPTFNAAYVKVTQPYSDKAFTFANLFPALLKALPVPPEVGGILGQYSRDGGRTWSAPEQVTAPSDMSKGSDQPGGFIVDPVTRALTAVFYSTGVSTGADWTDPAQHLTQIWVARASSYDAQGRPQFGSPQPLPIINPDTGKPASWAVTYTNPVRTKSGAYVVSVPFIHTPDGQFALAILRSTDQGASWTQSTSVLTSSGGGAGLEAGASESTVTQLSTGRLLIIARNEELPEYYFGTSYSDDDGVTWSPLTDSKILASNTSPDFLARDSGLLLSWSGHNAFGQSSYYRNNLTIAYSTDDAARFEKYHDVTGATSIATPGWKSTAETRRMQESFIVPSGADDLVIGWHSGAGSTGASMLIEGVDEYLHNSHGALDVIRYSNAGGATNGTELSQSRWWRTAAPGTVTLSDGVQAGRTAVRLTTTAGEGATGISRLFPGSRQARVRFRLRWDALGSGGAFFALQEAFAATGNAHGAIALFQLGSDGTVTVASDDVYDADTRGGFISANTDPAAGSLIWSGSAAVGFDYVNRSIGLYLGGKRDVTSLVLTGASQYASGGTTTRLVPSDLGVWISDTNNNDWTRVSGWTGTKQGLKITMTGPAFNAAYVKVTQPYSDTAFTFGNTFPQLLVALPDEGQPQTFRPLQTPTRLAAQQWHQVQLDVDLDANTIVTAIDGTTVSQLGSVHPAQVLTHFLALAGAGGGADFRIAELIVQDTSLGLPQLSKVNG